MPQLPENPNFAHLKKQAKDLLRLYHDKNPEAFARFRNIFLPPRERTTMPSLPLTSSFTMHSPASPASMENPRG